MTQANPHNPAFLSDRPWYLGEDEEESDALAHQKTHAAETQLVDDDADRRLRDANLLATRGGGRIPQGTWVEALRKGRSPHLPAKVVKAHADGTYDLEFDSGPKERRVSRASIRESSIGSRTQLGLKALWCVCFM